jgi:hypothetical protein
MVAANVEEPSQHAVSAADQQNRLSADLED